jgi:two-component system, OmpR family, response regulator MtrA
MATHRHRVLLLEDHDDSREGMASVLTLHGFQVLAVENGQAGLDVLRADPGPWCAILLDWRMPGMSGGEFLTRLRGDASQIATLPVVICSGDGVTPHVVVGHGVRVILAKPIDPDTLVVVLERECAARHLSRETGN